MKRASGVAAILLILVGGVPGGRVAAGAQMNPAAPPEAKGPLTLDNESYAGDHCTKTDLEQAVTKRCRFFYRFDPASETDPDQDYGVWWFQSVFRARSGHCLVAARTTVTMTDLDFVALDWSRKNRKIHKGKKPMGVSLDVTADGNTTTPGRVKKRFIGRKGRLGVSWEENQRTLTLSWKGRETKHKVALVGGLTGYLDPAGPVPAFTVKGIATYKEC